MSKEIYINTGTSFQQQYIARQPAIGTAPVTAQYDAQGNANSQSPFTYQNRTPFTYRNPVSNQTPYIANKQNPYPYIANSQTPYPASAQQPYPYPANAQQPYPYIAQGRQPGTYQATGRTPFTYQRTGQTPYPYIANSQTPFTYPANAQQPYPYQASKQTPFTYQHRTPYTYARQGQSPFTYNHRSPFTYQVSARTPYIYTFESNGTVAKDGTGKINQWYYMTSASPALPCSVLTHRDGGGLRLENVGSDWTSCRIGSSSSNYSTLTRAGMNYTSGSGYHTGGAWGGGGSGTYITNSVGASCYFALLG